ncbi:MAG TPA: GntR family transcriptional regulator [Intrasporangium sp.]|uniref:GntR family transcriptional regulator n=1 Tax=Intrasporangium sp. TaxID=1925024 RepID=UPI002D7830E8|nr:GntR family transcriptional regulator [Intrasporangium sp.]HET7399768.1 GntR family transcriptional regulator [Intrasporangium sp.]
MDERLGIAVDPGASEPPFEQVRAQLADLIESGRLLTGDRLPTVRALAGDLGLAANTVARAYKELEAAGLVQTRSRAGTVVASSAHSAEATVSALAAAFARAARAAGLDEAAAVDVVRAALRTAGRDA